METTSKIDYGSDASTSTTPPSEHDKLSSDSASTSITPPLAADISQAGLHPVIFPPDILEQLRINATTIGKVTLIGHIAGETPLLEDIETWVDKYLVNPPEILITEVSLLMQGYFSMTFTTKEGADKAFALSPVDCDHHVMFLHAWTPNFSPPPGEASLLWVLFPDLPRLYYPYLEYIANTIGRVVWQSDKATNIQRGYPPKIRVLVEDVRFLPGSVSLPLAIDNGWFDQRVSYEGMSNQICGKCKNLTIATDP